MLQVSSEKLFEISKSPFECSAGPRYISPRRWLTGRRWSENVRIGSQKQFVGWLTKGGVFLKKRLEWSVCGVGVSQKMVWLTKMVFLKKGPGWSAVGLRGTFIVR